MHYRQGGRIKMKRVTITRTRTRTRTRTSAVWRTPRL